MELRQLEDFAAVARHRHFTRAAEELDVTQSALSQQVRPARGGARQRGVRAGLEGRGADRGRQRLLERATAILAEAA